MNLFITCLLLLAGFVLLVKGSDIFVDGSASIAKIIGIPSIIVGLTIVSLGTSAPEAAVSITAGIRGSNEIAISNLVGSNTFNLLCVAGMSALISPFAVDRIVMKRDFPICLGIMALTVFMCITGRTVSRGEGILLLAIFVIYIAYLVYSALKNRKSLTDDEKPMPVSKSLIFIIVGIAAIIFGGQFVVNSAQEIARVFGMTETLIGVTIVAIGTSLPELVTSVVAAKKGESSLAIGNVIGSNILNLAFVLGMSSSFNSIAVGDEAFMDAVIMLGVNIIGYILCLTSKRLGRSEGAFLVAMYFGYTAYLLLR